MRPSDSEPWDPRLVMGKIRNWFERGVRDGRRYLLVCQDTFDLGDADMGIYPKFFDSIEEAAQFSWKQLRGIDVLLEAFDLREDMDDQLKKPRKATLQDLFRKQ